MILPFNRLTARRAMNFMCWIAEANAIATHRHRPRRNGEIVATCIRIPGVDDRNVYDWRNLNIRRPMGEDLRRVEASLVLLSTPKRISERGIPAWSIGSIVARNDKTWISTPLFEREVWNALSLGEAKHVDAVGESVLHDDCH